MACPVNCLYPIVIISVSLSRGSYSFSSLYSQHWPECKAVYIQCMHGQMHSVKLKWLCRVLFPGYICALMYPYVQIFIYVWKVVIRSIFSWCLLVSTENKVLDSQGIHLSTCDIHEGPRPPRHSDRSWRRRHSCLFSTDRGPHFFRRYSVHLLICSSCFRPFSVEIWIVHHLFSVNFSKRAYAYNNRSWILI